MDPALAREAADGTDRERLDLCPRPADGGARAELAFNRAC